MEKQVLEKVGRDEGAMGETVETDKLDANKGVANKMVVNNAAKQQHRLFLTESGPWRQDERDGSAEAGARGRKAAQQLWSH